MPWLADGMTKQCEKCGGTIRVDKEVAGLAEDGTPVLAGEVAKHLGSCSPPEVEAYAGAKP